MKYLKNLIFISFLITFLTKFSVDTLQAQISAGGTPISLGSNFKSLSTQDQVVKTVNLPKVDLKKVLEDDLENDYGNRFAVPVHVDFNLKNSGKWTKLSNGDKLWRLKIHSEGALSLRVLFEKYYLPEGAKLYIYDDSYQTILGAFTSRNNKTSGKLGTDIINASSITLEYYEPAKVKNQGEIIIKRVDHGYKKITFDKNTLLQKSGGTALGFEDSNSCNININCTQGNDWQDEKRGIVLIVLNDANGSDWCTGSLINNTTQDATPYVLSADHCEDGGGQSFIDSWVFVFNYEAPGCTNPASAPLRSQSMSGATIVSQSGTSDFLLLELSTSIPFEYDAYFNGWNRSDADQTLTTCIHHPSGDIKKISVDNDQTTTTGIQSNTVIPNGDFYRVVWDEGTTEGGSSGSPLFNTSGQIIGQLFGGFAACNATSEPDWYGKISSSWGGEGSSDTQLSNWLDPINQGSMSLPGRENIQLDNELAVSNIILDANECEYTSSTPIEVRVRNNGVNAQGPFTLAFTLKNNDVTVSSGNQTINTLASGQSTTITFNIDLSNTGSTVLFEAFLDGFTDENNFSNSKNLSINIPNLSRVSEFTYVEDFETGQGDWEVVNNASVGSSWDLGLPLGSVINKAASGSNAWVTNLNGDYSNNENSYLISPVFDFSNLSQLELIANVFVQSEESFDGLQIQISDDCGKTWSRLGALGTGQNWYNNTSNQLPFGEFGNFAWSGTADTTWKTVQHSLNDYANESNVRLRVLFRSDFSEVAEGFGFDNISIRDLVTSVENEINTNINLYPNPTQEQVIINFENNVLNNETLEIRLATLQGKFIRTFSWDQKENSLNISLDDLPSGLYILHIKSSKGEICKKILKE